METAFCIAENKIRTGAGVHDIICGAAGVIFRVISGKKGEIIL